jgi:hypothetical protein
MPVAGHHKLTLTLEQRRDLNAKAKPNHIMVIVEHIKDITDTVGDLKCNKFIVPYETTVGLLVGTIRSKLNLNDTTALFVLVDNGILMNSSGTIGSFWDKYKDEDGALYTVYAPESTWGNGSVEHSMMVRNPRVSVKDANTFHP